MKELDVLLEAYLETSYQKLSPAEQGSFVRLLQLEDPELYRSLVNGRLTGDEKLDDLAEKIRTQKRG